LSSFQPFGPTPGASASTGPAAGTSTEVRAAIARAAQATGVDFKYLLAQAKLESGLDPSARAHTSSATGLYQFTGSTWLSTLDKHGAEHGLTMGGAARDPAMRAQILAMRKDPGASALMAGELANDNSAYLSGVLGRMPDSAELYLAHFLGSDGAGRFLSALSTDPTQPAAALLPKAAAANRSIFYGASGAARSLGDVMDLIRGRVSNAMGDSGGIDGMQFGDVGSWASAATPTFTGGPVAQEFQQAASDAANSGGNRQAPATSMADTLRDAFALTGNGSGGVPDHVRAAYGQLRAFGL
jgi:hypothetical protein